MKRTIRTLLLCAALVLALALPTAALEPVNDLQSDCQKAVGNTLDWAKQGQSSIFNETFLTSGAVGDTGGDWLAFGVGRSGAAENGQSYLTALANYVTNEYALHGGLDKTKATEWHHVILAVLALGGDPTAFGEKVDGSAINLIADGVYSPLVGSLWKQGVNGAIWGLICLDAKNYETPAEAAIDRDDILTYILGQELSGGGFALTGTLADPDVTAMALLALAPYDKTNQQVHAVIDRAVTLLSGLQREDGDYATYGIANAESTAQVLMALCALDIDPNTDSRFSKNGHTVLDGLQKYYNSADGGFIHAFIDDPALPSAPAGSSNNMATDQARCALLAYSRFQNGQSRLFDFSTAAPDPTVAGEIAVLRIEGISRNLLFERELKFYQSESVGALLERVLTAKNISYAKNSYGYIAEINGEREHTFNVNYDGWLYRVNGDDPAVGMFDYPLSGDEIIELYYGPMDIAYPQWSVAAQNGRPVLTVTYTATDWTSGSPVSSEQPLAQATVTVNGQRYTTDERGQAVLTEAAGSYPITLSKTDAGHVVNGQELPLAVRLSPLAVVTVPAVASPADSMTDVVKSKWYYDDVVWVMSQGIMMGNGASTFGVGDTIRRCDFATVLGRYEKIADSSAANPVLTVFTDVSAVAYYAAHVGWANGQGIVYGTGTTSFSPGQNITRQDMAVLMSRYAKFANISLPDGSSAPRFGDDSRIAGYAKDAVYAMKAAGIIGGVGDNRFDPQGTATREQAARMLHLLLTE